MPDNPSYAGYKRLSYFTTQLLTERDFRDEQSFHLEMMRRHNAKLHIAGVIEGLDVGIGSDNKSVTLTPGSAIDPVGREIVLVANAAFQQPNFSDPSLLNKTVAIAISWSEQASTDAADQYTGGTQNFTRWVPAPAVSGVPSPATPSATNPFVVLAQVSVGADGKLSNLDTSVKIMAGSRVTRGSNVQFGSLLINPTDQKWTNYANNGPLTIVAPAGNDWLTLVPGAAGANFFLRNSDGNKLLLGYRTGGDPQKNHLVLQSADGNVGIGTASATDRLSIAGGALAFQKANEVRSIAGLDYDTASDALRVRFNPAATDGALSTTALSIERQTGNVKIPTGSLEITAGNLTVPAGNIQITGGSLTVTATGTVQNPIGGNVQLTGGNLTVAGTVSGTGNNQTITGGNVQLTNGNLGVSTAPDVNFVVDVSGPLRIKNNSNAGLLIASGSATGAGIIIMHQQGQSSSRLLFADGAGNVFMAIDAKDGSIQTKSGKITNTLTASNFLLF